MQIGIISSQRHPPDPYNWMRFHVETGITAFFITIEDTPDLGPNMTKWASELSGMYNKQVKVYYENASPIDRSKEDNYGDLIKRQQTRVDHMMQVARDHGVEWVFHIDDDELLYPGSKTAMSTWPEVLGRVSSSCASVHLHNWEAFSPEAPKGSWITDPGVRYLPQSCGKFFAAYGNGKSASRTSVGQTSWGPHHFRGGKECPMKESEGVVLHHEALAMGPGDLPPQRWVEKNRLRANDDMSKIPFPATHEAVRAVSSGDEQTMRGTWTKFRSVAGEKFRACPTPVSLPLPSHSWSYT